MDAHDAPFACCSCRFCVSYFPPPGRPFGLASFLLMCSFVGWDSIEAFGNHNVVAGTPSR